MEFGLLKSKIETRLVESYKNKTFNKEIKTFKKLVLEDKEISKIYHLYNELSKEKGFKESFAEDFLDESISLYNLVKVNPKKILRLENWVKGIKCENQYKDIDTVFSKNTFIVENIISAKNNIISNLTKKESKSEPIKIPLNKMVEVANTTLKNYLSNLNESELKEIQKYATLSQDDLNQRYEFLSEMVIEKLEKISNESELEVKNRIQETVTKIKSDKVDSLSLLKLKGLNENL
jgi:hypothetical protein